jgi:MOSC domain-containing protein YiiM
MDTATQPRHRTRDELEARLDWVLDAPKDQGTLRQIVVRPEHGKRQVVDSIRIGLATGLEGDHWAKGCWKSLGDGSPDPDVQICMMSARMIEAIAGDPANWAPAGDNLFLDADLSPGSMPPGTRFALGEAELVVTPVTHNGCEQFIARYGRDACVFVNTGKGRENRLRGIYARVTRDGVIRTGVRLRKLG